MQEESMLPQERIVNRIFLIRGRKVMLDRDLAMLYGVETKTLKRAVKRNLDRFPSDFLFELSKDEAKNLRYHFGTSSWGGTRYESYAFTEQGVAMLSSILRSKKAIQVNIQIVRTFIKIRQMLSTNRDLRLKVENMERNYDQKFRIVFDAIKRMIASEEKPKRILGFVYRKEDED